MFEAIEFATLEGADGFNDPRLVEPIGDIPPAEAEERSYAMFNEDKLAAAPKPGCLRQTRGGSFVGSRPGYPATSKFRRAQAQAAARAASAPATRPTQNRKPWFMPARRVISVGTAAARSRSP